jgi:hypothetical protein
MKVKIGGSVSYCIKWAINNGVKAEDMPVIVGHTMCVHFADWMQAWKHYCEYEWKGIENEAYVMLFRLLNMGKIRQPRVMGRGTPAQRGAGSSMWHTLEV